MKITGLEIGEYRQFKNIKFDFTYPEGHAKAGQPLDKVCFIGQSGTGKTTLLNVIADFFRLIIGYPFYPRGVVQYLDQVDFSYTKQLSDTIENYETVNVRIPLDNTVNIYELVKPDFANRYSEIIERAESIDKLCIYIKDNVAREANAFLLDQTSTPKTFSDFIKTESQIDKEKLEKEQLIDDIAQSQIINLGDLQSLNIWQYLLKDINDYDDQAKELALKIIYSGNGSSETKKIEELIKWKSTTKSPKTELAEKCLNPILDKLFLEVDTDVTVSNTPIAIRTKRGIKIDSSKLSTGTRQLLSTAISIFKFNTDNSVILFDEPERSLFPDIQRELIGHYTSLAPTAQFFFATHSPIIASAFEPCERFILYFDENGEVKFHNGVAPEGDDPNDILSEDFGLEELMLPKGLEAYERYRNLGVEIRNEKDPKRKDELIVERAQLGDLYKF
ncbi:AAA family ATPase [Larkinella punicea]|uniref:AAA+ ATPase domain-containing protein n=1 Tax=Larkinella punicea TaxID=2315727 RepID=A0A368JV14_9BACT|nr:AAA family ATPase [Larkinella punicea]RCR71302.1 hypothetical protein DUE52_03400 [Larkinella punicea]